MNDMSENRRLSGIMFTDIVGYSAIMQKSESAAMKLLADHKNIVQMLLLVGVFCIIGAIKKRFKK